MDANANPTVCKFAKFACQITELIRLTVESTQLWQFLIMLHCRIILVMAKFVESYITPINSIRSPSWLGIQHPIPLWLFCPRTPRREIWISWRNTNIIGRFRRPDRFPSKPLFVHIKFCLRCQIFLSCQQLFTTKIQKNVTSTGQIL